MNFQKRVHKWVLNCFGAEIAHNNDERNYRFVEEALELAQANGCSKESVLQLVDYVFSRPVGQREQEVGGVMITLAALCNCMRIDMDASGNLELARIWCKIDQIQQKNANKPDFSSPLPQ